MPGGSSVWRERFAEFAARKERQARSAAISPFKTALDLAPDTFVAIGNRWSRELFDGPFRLSPLERRDIPATSLVFVQSSDGNTGARNPASLGGGEADTHLIYEGLSRVAAHGVLAGAETIRGGHLVFSVWHPELVALRMSLGLPRHPVQIVATLKGLMFEDTLLYNVPDLPVVVLTVPSCVDVMREEFAKRPWITTVMMKRPDDLPSAFRVLRGMGIERVSAVGGRTVARAFIDAGLVQDLYLTTAARPGGEPNTPLSPTPLSTSLVVRKHGTGPDAGVVFEHLTLQSYSAI